MHNVDLRAIRRASGITQRKIAETLGMHRDWGRATVSQMEMRDDWLLSRIASYVQACGGEAELVVHVNGQTLRFNITEEIDGNES